ncbi:MAG: hypothetical protein Q9166_000284 [cf. Caloplaca sp. 2 TL-2023]
MDFITSQSPEQYDQFIHLMYQKLSLELVDMIERYTYEALFCPGIIHPKVSEPPSRPSTLAAADNHSGKKGTARPALLCLSKSIHKKYQHRMLGENTFVMGTGPKTTRFLNQLPLAIGDHIRTVYVPLSIRDHDEQYSADLEGGVPALKVNNEGNGGDFLYASSYPDQENRILQQYLILNAGAHLFKTWLQKIDDVCKLPSLAEFVLDLSECYDPDGAWLGEELLEKIHSRRLLNPEVAIVTIRPHPEKKGETIALTWDPKTCQGSRPMPASITCIFDTT